MRLLELGHPGTGVLPEDAIIRVFAVLILRREEVQAHERFLDLSHGRTRIPETQDGFSRPYVPKTRCRAVDRRNLQARMELEEILDPPRLHQVGGGFEVVPQTKIYGLKPLLLMDPPLRAIVAERPGRLPVNYLEIAGFHVVVEQDAPDIQDHLAHVHREFDERIQPGVECRKVVALDGGRLEKEYPFLLVSDAQGPGSSSREEMILVYRCHDRWKKPVLEFEKFAPERLRTEAALRILPVDANP